MSKSSIFLYSEPYSSTGNTASKGILNQLGRPKLDIFTVLVREAVQNSWDARASADGSIRFGISVWSVDKKQREGLRLFFQNIPPGLQLSDVLSGDREVLLMSIYDRGTVGLGGPTRADHSLNSGEAHDFVDFLRNVGQPPDKKLSGGTYGYGKAAFYRASRAQTILIHTRCMWQGAVQSRFIGAALGEPYVLNGRRFTGRHWWGREDDNIAEPLIGIRADRIAEFLSLPTYQDDERGTTITIIQPAFDNSIEQTIYAMRDALLWYFWPKMILNEHRRPSIDFEMSWQGQPIEIPAPEQFPPLDLFVKAMMSLKSCGRNGSIFGRVIDITSQRPKQHLGKLALEKGLAKKRDYANLDGAPIPIGERCHHIALMRQPELVVRYLACEGLPSDSVEYAGVFITSEEVDRIFADAETPTHDDWVSNFLEEKHARTFVNVAFSRITESASAFVRPTISQGQGSGETLPLGAFANKLGQLLIMSDLPDRKRPKPMQRQQQSEPIDIPIIPISSQMAVPTARMFTASHSHKPAISSSPSSAFEVSSIDKADFTLTNRDSLRQSSLPAPDHLSTAITPTQPFGHALPHQRGFMQVKLHPDSEFILLDDGTPTIGFRLEVMPVGGSARVRIHASARVVLDDGSFEDDPPQGAAVTRVLFWQSPQGVVYPGSPFIDVDDNSAGVWWVLLSVIDDAQLGLEIKSEQLP